MRKLIINKSGLKEKDITEVVKRVKVMLINSNNAVLLAYSHNEYQFPGGHVEEGEELLDTVIREVKEETGIELVIKDIEPFQCSIGYWKDWPEEGKNRKTEIYYYVIPCNAMPDIEHLNLTENEKEGNFTLKYIPLNLVVDEIEKNALAYGDKHGIAKEMVEVLKGYISTYERR